MYGMMHHIRLPAPRNVQRPGMGCKPCEVFTPWHLSFPLPRRPAPRGSLGKGDQTVIYAQAASTQSQEHVEARMSALPQLRSSARALIQASTGATAAALTCLQARGISDILVVWDDEQQLDGADPGQLTPLGNEAGIRWWQGSLATLPAYQGPVELVVLLLEQATDTSSLCARMLQAALRLKAEGYVAVIAASREHQLQVASWVPEAAQDLPLRVLSHDSPLLQVPQAFAHAQAPICLEGDVTTGFGRGSASMGTPTANLPPEPLQEQLAGLPLGVYFGWARVDVEDGQPEADSEVHPMVLNIGRRPTVEADSAAAITVEAHIMHTFAAGFYGRHCRALVCGFIRPEVKFAGLPALIARIKTDIGIARTHLQDASHQQYLQHDCLRAPTPH